MKNIKIAWRETRKQLKSIWSYIWGLICFAWTVYITLEVNGTDKTAELIVSKLMLGLAPYLAMVLLLYLYHLIRSDLYLKADELNDQLLKAGASDNGIAWAKRIGYLYGMYETWREDGYGSEMWQPAPRAYNAYHQLEQIGNTFLYPDDTRKNIKLFLTFFKTQSNGMGNLSAKVIITSKRTEKEVKTSIPELKELAKTLTKALNQNT